MTKSKHAMKLLQLVQHQTEFVENASSFWHLFSIIAGAKSTAYFLFAHTHTHTRARETELFPMLLAFTGV